MSTLLLVGLGNPGAKYAGNRHNIGFMAIDAIVQHNGFGPFRKRFHGQVSEGRLDGPDGPVKVIALKPETFMNESGRSVAQAVRFYKLGLDRVTVFYDELDLAPGKFRFKTGGGAAGHNGIKSITSAIGPDYHRARMGIGHPGAREKVHGHVLSDFYKAEQTWVTALCDAIAASIGCLTRDRVDQFQSKVTHRAPAPEPGDR